METPQGQREKGGGDGIKKERGGEQRRRSARTTRRGKRSAGENSFRSNQGVVFFHPLLPDVDVHPQIFLFPVLIFVASNSVRNTPPAKRSYACSICVCVCVCVCASLLPLASFIPPLLCSLAASGQEEAGAGQDESECTVPVSSWNPTGGSSWFVSAPVILGLVPGLGAACSGWGRFTRRAAAANWNSSSSSSASCCSWRDRRVFLAPPDRTLVGKCGRIVLLMNHGVWFCCWYGF